MHFNKLLQRFKYWNIFFSWYWNWSGNKYFDQNFLIFYKLINLYKKIIEINNSLSFYHLYLKMFTSYIGIPFLVGIGSEDIYQNALSWEYLLYLVKMIEIPQLNTKLLKVFLKQGNSIYIPTFNTNQKRYYNV